MTMLVLYLLVLCASALAHVRPSPDLYDLEDAENIFEEFINKYNKVYASEQEKQERFNIFKDNLKEINELRLSEKGKLASFGINNFADWSEEEFQSTLGFKPGTISSVPEPVNAEIDVPDSLDWRKSNVITPVKNQFKCGSCWAFSTTGGIEAAYAIKHKQLLSFSEQQLVDCDYNDGGCKAGRMDNALNYLKEKGGIELESDYAYVGEEEVQCKFNSTKVKARIVGQRAFDLSNVTATKQALTQYGPISIAVHANFDWYKYTGGIMDCPDGIPTHGVLLVGYGTEGGAYWLIKNSWGDSWGENGYIRIKQGLNDHNNVCAMSRFPGIVPTVE